jgi:hypothetical protein
VAEAPPRCPPAHRAHSSGCPRAYRRP